MKTIFALFLALTATASIASADTCFWANGVRSYSVTGRDQITVREGRHDYQVDLSFCHELDWAHQIGFDSFSSRVCRGDKVILLDAWGRVLDRCWINEITQAN